MTDSSAGIGTLLLKGFATALGGPQFLARSIAIATASAAEICLGLIHEGWASDIGRIKESLLCKMEAEADEEAAKAQKMLAEAAEAENRADLPKRRDAFAQAKKRHAQARTAKTEAETEAIRMDAETRRMEAVAKGKAALLEALFRLKQEGGDLMLDSENLRRIMREELPPIPEDDSDEDDTNATDPDAGH